MEVPVTMRDFLVYFFALLLLPLMPVIVVGLILYLIFFSSDEREYC